MKRFSIVLLALLLLVVSCSPVSNVGWTKNNGQTVDYTKIPFTSGTEIADITSSVTKSIVGTYEVSVYGKIYQKYIASLYADGTVKAIGEGGTLSATSDVMDGTWSTTTDGKISIKIGTILDYTDQPYDYEKWSTRNLMRIEDSRNSYYIYFSLFYKISNSTMDTSVYKNPSTVAGLYAKSDDYGKVIGYRFLSDGTVYWYSTESTTGKGTKLSWLFSKTKAEMKMSQEGYSTDQTYSFAKVGDYILLNSTSYKIVK